jgi:putative NADH-flavin reductase
MRLVIFGATGATGRCLVDQALAQGHQVLACARNPAPLGKHDRLAFLPGDVLEPTGVEVAVAGQDAVLCALGTPNQIGTTVLSAGTANIIAAMQKHRVRRLICLSSLGVGDSKQQAGVVVRHVVIPTFLSYVYADKETQERVVRDSGLDWVIVRPARLTDGPRRGVYRTGPDVKLRPWTRISRADVADFMLKQLTDDTFLRQAPGISY